ncbi:hypothetical protein ES706_03997 [subsurface metagenome]
MKGVDANIIVYALNSDLPEYNSCNPLIEKIAVGDEIVSISSIVFMESYHALVYKYRFSASEVKKRIIAILESENVVVLNISTGTILYAFEIASFYNTGGRDSLIAANLLENNVKEIYSHDRAFDIIEEINRIDPVKNI